MSYQSIAESISGIAERRKPTWAERQESARLAAIAARREAYREAEASRVVPTDVDVDAWEATRGGYRPSPMMDLSALIEADHALKRANQAQQWRYEQRDWLKRLSIQFAADRAQWRPFFAQFDRSDARTWWRWRKRDRVARMRRRMDLDD